MRDYIGVMYVPSVLRVIWERQCSFENVLSSHSFQEVLYQGGLSLCIVVPMSIERYMLNYHNNKKMKQFNKTRNGRSKRLNMEPMIGVFRKNRLRS